MAHQLPEQVANSHQHKTKMIGCLSAILRILPVLWLHFKRAIRSQQIAFSQPRTIDPIERTGFNQDSVLCCQQCIHKSNITLELSKIPMENDFS